MELGDLITIDRLEFDGLKDRMYDDYNTIEQATNILFQLISCNLKC